MEKLSSTKIALEIIELIFEKYSRELDFIGSVGNQISYFSSKWLNDTLIIQEEDDDLEDEDDDDLEDLETEKEDQEEHQLHALKKLENEPEA